MKQYKETNFGIEYHVIEYDDSDGVRGSLNSECLNELIIKKDKVRYLKVIDRMYKNEVINYYIDGMKHNDFGPATVDNGKEKFYILNEKVPMDEFKNWKRTKLMDGMLDEKR